jgi:hypothetical protein
MKGTMAMRRWWRRCRTRERRRAKTYAFYHRIAPDAREDPRYPWPRLALAQFKRPSAMNEYERMMAPYQTIP